ISALSGAASFSGLVTCTASTIGVPSGVHAMPTLLFAPYEPPPVLSATVHVFGSPARRRLPLVVLLSSQWVRSARSRWSRASPRTRRAYERPIARGVVVSVI